MRTSYISNSPKVWSLGKQHLFAFKSYIVVFLIEVCILIYITNKSSLMLSRGQEDICIGANF